jgi:hypothetical protein
MSTPPNPAQRMEADRTKFPAMQIDEILVWKRWLEQYQGLFERFDYDAHVGTGVDPGPTLAEPYRSMAINLSRGRIDAVGWQAGVPTIFEVERYSKARSIGQLLTYRALWESQNPSAAAPAIALVDAGFDPNIVPALEQHGIDHYTVPVNFSALAPTRLR